MLSAFNIHIISCFFSLYLSCFHKIVLGFFSSFFPSNLLIFFFLFMITYSCSYSWTYIVTVELTKQVTSLLSENSSDSSLLKLQGCGFYGCTECSSFWWFFSCIRQMCVFSFLFPSGHAFTLTPLTFSTLLILTVTEFTWIQLLIVLSIQLHGSPWLLELNRRIALYVWGLWRQRRTKKIMVERRELERPTRTSGQVLKKYQKWEAL